jgi:hypothetical protein
VQESGLVINELNSVHVFDCLLIGYTHTHILTIFHMSTSTVCVFVCVLLLIFHLRPTRVILKLILYYIILLHRDYYWDY